MGTERVGGLPGAVIRSARRHCGPLRGMERLAGLSGTTVARLTGERADVVVKGPASRAEVAVCRDLVRPLGRLGVRTPTVLDLVEVAPAQTWIVMEYLPRELPRERWGPDPQVLAMLAALHATPTAAVRGLPGRYRPRWDDRMTRDATRLLGPEVVPCLSAWAPRARPLFEPRAVISGDPNPKNWRVTAQNRPVLLDLERLTLASPALDLAILLPGLPTIAEVDAVLREYASFATSSPPERGEVMTAKAWTVVELAASARPGTPAAEVVLSVAPAFLDWSRSHAADG